MKLRKKALFPAIAMVLASVIALSGVTYAWFTTGNTASVETLNVNVQTANGIQVSLDAENWRSTLTAEDFKKALENTSTVVQLPANPIVPVSSAGNVTNGVLELFKGEYIANGNMKSTQETDTRGTVGNYIAFDLFFKSTMDQDLTFNIGDIDSTLSYVKGIAIDATAKASANAHTAVRVAFIPMGTAKDEEGNDTNPFELTASGTALIWEPNANLRANGDSGDKIDYSGFKTKFDDVAEKDLSTNEVAEVETFTTDKKIISLKEGISKVRVYIWLEGQDVDCVNSISFGDFAVNLAFSVPKLTTNNG